MEWIPAIAAAALAFGTMLVLVRRRWGTERLIVAAFLGALALAGGALALGLADEGYEVFVLVVAVASATSASAWAVERIVRSATVPDPLVEVLAGGGAFVGGALAGNVVGYFLVALSMPRIG
jgi:hypothetical protein